MGGQEIFVTLDCVRPMILHKIIEALYLGETSASTEAEIEEISACSKILGLDIPLNQTSKTDEGQNSSSSNKVDKDLPKSKARAEGQNDEKEKNSSPKERRKSVRSTPVKKSKADLE